MKLHLPTRLRAAVLACVTAVAALATTVGTGALTTGVAAYSLASSVASAADPVIGTDVTLGASSAFEPDPSTPYAYDHVTIGSSGVSKTIVAGGMFFMYANRLDGAGNITLNRTHNGGNLTLLWLDGDCSGYTGTISLTAGTSQARNIHLGIGGNGTSSGAVTLSNATLELNWIVMDVQQNATIKTLSANNSQIAAVNLETLPLVVSPGSGSTGKTAWENVTAVASTDVARELTLTNDLTLTDSSVYKGITLKNQGTNSTIYNSSISGKVINEAGATLTLSGTIKLEQALTNNGTMVFNQENIKFDLSALTPAEGGIYTLVQGTVGESFTSLGNANILNPEAGYSYQFMDDGTLHAVLSISELVWNGGNGTWNDSEENWLKGSAAAHFSNEDKVTFSTEGAQVTLAGDKTSLGVTIEADTTWTGNAKVTTTTIGGTGTLSLENGATLQVTEAATGIKLAGNGTYIMPVATTTLGATLAETWTGTVAVNRDSNNVLTVTDFNFDNFGRTGSTVEVTALRGYMPRGTNVINSNIVFKNSPNGSFAAFEINNGYGGAVYTFNGSISGSGNFVGGNCGNGWNTYTFNGDLSGWTGRFQHSGGSRHLIFGDEATVMNCDFLMTGGTADITNTNGLTIKNLTSNGGTLTVLADTNVTKLYQAGAGTLNIGTASSPAVVTAARLESGDAGSGNPATINVAAGSVLKVTGGDVTSDAYKNTGVVLGEWGISTSLNVNGTLLSANATLQPGDKGYTLTIAEGGVVAAKGIGNPTTAKAAKEQTINLNVNGGTLVLGSGGIVSTHDVNTTVTGNGTLGVMAEEAMINHAIVLGADATLTVNTNLQTIGESGLSEGTEGGTLIFNSVLSAAAEGEATGAVTVTGAGKAVLNAAGAFGTGAVTVAEGGTLALKVGDAISADQTVTNAGTVILHDTVTSGTIANNGSLVIASGFAGLEGAGIVGIEGVSTDGNGFTSGGTATIFTPATAAITGSLTATFAGAEVTIGADGTVTLGDDWGTYHMNNAPSETETFGAISGAVAAHSATLEAIEIVPENTTLKVDADGLATSMLTGAGAATTTLAMQTGTTLTVDTTTLPTITAADDASITLNMKESVSTTLASITGAATLNVTGSDSSRTLSFNNGNINRVLNITDATVVAGNSGGTGFNTQATNINAGGVLRLAGGDSLGWGGNAAGLITLTGTEEKVATLQLGARQTLKTSLVMNGNSLITAITAGDHSTPMIDPYGGTLTVTGTNNVINTGVRQRSAWEITVQEDATLVFDGTVMSLETTEGDAGITKKGTGSLTFLNASGTLRNYTADAGDTILDNTVFTVGSNLDLSHDGNAAGVVKLTNASALSFANGVNLWMNGNTSIEADETSSVTFTREDYTLAIKGVTEGTPAVIAGTQNAYYDLNDACVFSNAEVTMTSSADKTVSTKLADVSLVNAGSGTLTVSHTENTAFTSVNAQGGDITLNAATSIGSLTIAGGKTVTASAESPLSITTALTAGAGATLSSALSIGNGAALDLVTGNDALSLGSNAVTLGTGLTVTETMMNAITSLAAESSLTLMKGVSSLTGGDVDATSVISGLTGDYTIKVQDGNLVVSAASLPAADLTWLGGDGTWGGESTPWTSDSGDSAYVAGANVTIGGEGGATGGTITVSGEQTAKAVTIVESGYAIQRADSGTNSLTIQGALTVAEGVSFSSTFLPTVGSIVLNEGSELFFNNASYVGLNGNLQTILGKVTAESTGTLKMSGGPNFNNNVTNRVDLNGGDLTISGVSVDITENVAFNAWNRAGAELVVESSLTVGSELRMESNTTLNIKNGGSVTVGTLGLGHTQAGNPGHLVMEEGSSLTTGSIASNAGGNAAKPNVMDVNGGTLTITGATAFSGTGVMNVNVGAATIKNGETDMAFNHASTLTGTTISAQNDKTITVGGTGMTTTLAGTITTEGKVTLDGTLNTTALTALNNSGVLSITGDSVELKGSVLNNTGTLATTGALTLTDAATVGGTVNAGSLSLTGANTFDAITTGALTIADSLNVTGALTATGVTITNVSLSTTALTAGSFVGDSLALTVDEDAIATAMGTSATTLTLANITGLTAATINGGDSFTVGSREYTIGVDSGLVTITAEISDQFIWDATTEGSVWGDATSWEGNVQPTETSNVVFNGTGIADVTIGGNAVAGAVFVEADTNFIPQTTGNVATGSVEVSAGTLTIDEDVTVVASGTTSVVNETGNLIIKGALQTDTLAATGKDVQLSGTLTVDTEGAVNSIGGIGGDYGHLIVGTDAELTLLDVVEEKLTIAADSTVNELEVKHTGNLDAKGTFTVNSTADVAAGGVMTVAKDLTISDDLTNAGSITVGSAAAPATLATEDVTNSGTITVFNTMTSTGDVDNQTGATLDVKGNLTANTAGKTVTNAGNLQVGGTANATALTTTDGSTTTVKGNTTITGALNNGGTLTVGTQAAPAMLATGDVVNNGTITVFNTMTSTGDVTNNAGKTLDVKGNLTANTAGKTVNNEGTMTIGGAADVATLTTGDNATSTITGNATVATALSNAGSTSIGGTLTATNAAVTNEATGAGEKLTVTGALTADTLTTAAGATTEAKGGATLGSELANHGTTTVTGDLASADATAPITITNDATGAGEKLTVTGNVTAKSLTTETGATTDITGTGKTVKLTDSLTNKGTTTIKGALTSADATATDPGSLSIENTGTLSTGKLTADSLSGNGATTVTGNATMKKLNLGTTGSLTASGTVKTDSVLSTGGSVTADTLDLSGLTAAATIADIKADKITLSGFNMLKVTDSISNENGTGAAKVMLSLDAATMSTLSVGDEKVVVATDGSVAGQGITLGNLAAVNSALKAYGIKGAMVTTAAGELVMQMQDNSFVSQIATSENGIAGAEMVDAASAAGLATAGTALGDIYAALDACRTTGDAATGDRIAAAVTGSSIAAMGAALSGDVERQLRAIRNRTTTMGVNQGVINEDMPYFNAWVNAEGDYRKVAADGTLAGYKMTSWGGTVGMDVDVTPTFTCGLAATAMYGDFDADGTDSASGDIDTYYVSAFARYAKHRWTHTFVATVGLAETSLERTILGHTVKGDSDGMMFGGMYEVGYVFALDKDATTCLQPVLNVSYTHATLNGYDESGSNAALSAGDVEFNKLTVGAGARLQSVVGENIYNRSSILEARALVKFDAGDRQGEADVTFVGSGLPTHTTKSSETGVIGAEIGVGLTVPVGSAGGSIFADASAEIRAEYTNVNATVGYRVNF